MSASRNGCLSVLAAIVLSSICGSYLNGATVVFTYSYDPLNRVTNAAYSDGSSESYSYDNAGNRQTRTTGAATVKLDNTSPSVPTNLVQASFIPSQLVISWNRAFDTGGSGLAGYQIFLNGTNIAATAGTNFLLTGLQPNSQYCLAVVAYDHSGNISAASLPICVTTGTVFDTQPPLLTVLFPTNNAVFFTNLISVSGTATDAGQGNNGISSVTINGMSATGVPVPGNTTSQWSLSVSLMPGYNPFRVITQDGSTNQNRATNDLFAIRAIAKNDTPVIANGIFLSGNQFAPTFVGNKGTTYGLWASTNLIDWILLANVTLTNWVQQLVDADASKYVRRFYRSSVPAMSAATNATVIADGLNSPSSLTLDGGDIYFADNATNNGIVKTVSKLGGAVTTLITGATLFNAGSYRGVDNLCVANATIYGNYGDYDHMYVFSGPENGGALTNLAYIFGGKCIGVVGTNLYYSSDFHYLKRMPATGGSATLLFNNDWIRSSTLDSNAIYHCDYWTKNIRRYDLATGALITLVSNASESGVFIDNTNLYFNITNSIRAIPKTGGTVTTLVSSTNATGYVSDGVRVYYVENDVVKSIPVGGGASRNEINIPGNSLNSLVVDDAFIYWTDVSGGNGAGKIWRKQK